MNWEYALYLWRRARYIWKVRVSSKESEVFATKSLTSWLFVHEISPIKNIYDLWKNIFANAHDFGNLKA